MLRLRILWRNEPKEERGEFIEPPRRCAGLMKNGVRRERLRLIKLRARQHRGPAEERRECTGGERGIALPGLQRFYPGPRGIGERRNLCFVGLRVKTAEPMSTEGRS